MQTRGNTLAQWIAEDASAKGVELLSQCIGGVFNTLLGVTTVSYYRQYCRLDSKAQRRFHQMLQERGVRIMARGIWMMSTAHTDDDLETTRTSVNQVLDLLSNEDCS
jgi:glutamate-1-semialdehyde aminotransferase